jgi:xanthine dehydrogenase small subunit
MRTELLLYLNGQQRRVRGEDAFLTVSTWLRQVERAIGTKVVCEEGDCGACTVLVGRLEEGKLRYSPVNSCIQVVAQLDCTHLVTVEGLAAPGELSPIQEAMVDHHGAQCGFCTPGFVVAMTALGEEKKTWSATDVKDALTGNLCRCTGYASIIEAGLAASNAKWPTIAEMYSSQSAIAPVLAEERTTSLAIESERRRFFAPASLDEAVRIKAEHPDLVIVQGGTDIGVIANKRGITPATLMSLAHVRELHEFSADTNQMTVGGAVTLARLEREVESIVPEFHGILRLFGSPQIRNAGTLAGNIANGSPIADTLPFLFITGTEIELGSVRGRRRVNINQLYRGYKQLDMAPDELITRIIIPLPSEDETIKLYKVSRRRDLDISAFTAAFRFRLDGDRMHSVQAAFGGVAATVIRVAAVESFLEGKTMSEETFRRAGEIARKSIKPITDVRGSAEFRSTLAENILMKLYFELAAV